MRLAVLTGPGAFERREVPSPDPGPGEVRVDVAVSGVCASDLGAYTGRAGAAYPLFLGHEVSGLVSALGPGVDQLAVGDPVGLWVTSHGYAEQVVAPAANCLPLGEAPLVSALIEPLACAVNAIEPAGVRLGDDVVVIGAGYMGLLVVRLLQLRGARRIVVVDTRADALDRARTLGATHTVRAAPGGDDDVGAAVAAATDGALADVCVECTGSQAALGTIGRVTRMSGTVVLVGFHLGADRVVPLGYWNWMAYDLRNGHVRDPAVILHGLRTATRLTGDGLVDQAPLVTHRFGLDDVDAAFRAAVERPDGFVKAVVVP